MSKEFVPTTYFYQHHAETIVIELRPVALPLLNVFRVLVHLRLGRLLLNPTSQGPLKSYSVDSLGDFLKNIMLSVVRLLWGEPGEWKSSKAPARTDASVNLSSRSAGDLFSIVSSIRVLKLVGLS